MTAVEPTTDGCRIRVRAQPRASTSAVAGLHGGAIKVRIAAPPVDGAANAELVRFLAERLDTAPRNVDVVRGGTGRDKIVRVRGVTAEAARRRLGL